MWTSFVIALEFFLFALPLHVLLCRLTSSYKFMMKSLLLGLFVVLFLAGYQHQRNSVDLVSLYVLGTLWFSYLMLIVRLIKSPSFKMLHALASNPNGELHLNEFRRFFKEDEGLRNRIISMKTNGFIALRRERLCLTPKAKHTLSFVVFVRRLFSLDLADDK